MSQNGACSLGYIWPFAQFHAIEWGNFALRRQGADRRWGQMTQKASKTGARAQETELRLHRTVALVGMMGSGKSAIGRSLAARLGVEFKDSDAEIETAANATISEVFARDGEAFFRDRESEVIARLLAGPPCILSTGGGAYLAERNRSTIGQSGVAVWLDADLEILWERVRHKDTRPLLRTSDPKATLIKLLSEREPIYRLAEIHARADSSYTIEDMTNHVIDVLKNRPDILESLPDAP